MPKKIIQDIISKKTKIPRPVLKEKPPVRPAKTEPVKPKPAAKTVLPKKPATVPPRPEKTKKTGKQKTKKGKIIFGIFALLFLLVVGAKVVGVFAYAIIKVVPHAERIDVDSVFKAGESSSFDTSYQTMETSVTKENSVDAVGTEEVSTKASGQITVYNAYSSQSQTFVANTRFESDSGKIYRTNERITVPGAKIENGEIIPSSIDVVVQADEPGQEYNTDSASFKIPGLEGSPRYDKFYAKTKTPLDGGFQGVLPVISEDNRVKMKEALETSIKKNLLEKIRAQAPADYLFYENALKINFIEDKSANMPAGTEENPKFTMRETGNLLGFLIPKEELTNALVKKYLGDEFAGKVTVGNIEDLDFSLVSYDDEGQVIVFKIKGKANFVWTVEEDVLKNALIAQPKNIEEVFKSFPAVDKASVVFKPFWWKFFPTSPSKISIEKETI